MNIKDRINTFSNINPNLSYYLLCGSMIIIFFFFGYAKWFPYEAIGVAKITPHSPLIFWLLPLFGFRGEAFFLGCFEWLFGLLLLIGLKFPKIGFWGALGSCLTFFITVTIIPFMPFPWESSAGGFPAPTSSTQFLLKDLVLLATSVFLVLETAKRIK